MPYDTLIEALHITREGKLVRVSARVLMPDGSKKVFRFKEEITEDGVTMGRYCKDLARMIHAKIQKRLHPEAHY